MKVDSFPRAMAAIAIVVFALWSPAKAAPAAEGPQSPVFWLRLAARDAQPLRMDNEKRDWNDDQALVGEAQVLAGDLEEAAVTAAALLKSAAQATDWAIAAKNRLSAASLLISCGKSDQTRPLLVELEKLAASNKDPWLVKQLVVQQTRLGDAAAGTALCARLKVDAMPYVPDIAATLIKSNKAAAGNETLQAHSKAVKQATSNLEPPDQRDAMVKVVDELAQDGCYDQAWAVLNGIDYKVGLMDNWRQLAVEQYSAGQTEAARIKIKSVMDGIELSSGSALLELGNLALSLYDADDIPDALEAIRRGQTIVAKASQEQQVDFHVYALNTYGHAGDLAGVRRERAIIAKLTQETFPAVAIALAEAGELEEAEKLAVQLSPVDKPRTLAQIYYALVRSGRTEDAIRMFPEKLPPGSEPDVAHAMIRKGQFEQLASWAAALRDPESKASAELAAAEALLKVVSASTGSTMEEKFVDPPPMPRPK